MDMICSSPRAVRGMSVRPVYDIISSISDDNTLADGLTCLLREISVKVNKEEFGTDPLRDHSVSPELKVSERRSLNRIVHTMANKE